MRRNATAPQPAAENSGHSAQTTSNHDQTPRQGGWKPKPTSSATIADMIKFQKDLAAKGQKI